MDEYYSQKVITGDTNHLYPELKKSFNNVIKIDIIVSFLMESGVRMLLNDLKEVASNGVKISILTGNYLNITQPSALYLLKSELKDIDLRFYNNSNKSFHPKAYIFHYKDYSKIYIGSSNISRSTLTYGIEWNYCFSSLEDKDSFDRFYHTFIDLYENHSLIIDEKVLKDYSKSWRKPAVYKDLSINKEEQIEFKPRGAQIEALYALENSRNDGATKGLVHAATGIGKTYLAAFDSIKYKRVLFVAHREEILKQAAQSFVNVRHSDDYGFFNDKNKDTNKSLIFASVFTLGKSEYLNTDYFDPTYFDYIVVDEFHHAITNQYQNIVNYFKPKFLLGLTATPERMDGRSIYHICDYNVPYEITMKEAINKGMLVPFHYYGIYDETDYSSLKTFAGKYKTEDLDKIYKNNIKRYDLIYKYYQKYSSKRALGFCTSRKHAEEMAKQFNLRGIKSVAVYSDAQGEFSEQRDIAIKKLKNLDINVIFSVDMFNEGVDIQEVDMVMFLRPTESPVIFQQQLGRGLRLHEGKTHLTVLDFIGNYRNANNAPLLLSGEANHINNRVDYYKIEYPDDCIVDFDMRLIDLFKELERSTMTINDQIKQEYYRIKELLHNKIPTRMELFNLMDDKIYEYCIKHPNNNIFKKYIEYLYELGELPLHQQSIYKSKAGEFLELIETTNMQKVYKMIVLQSFYNNGHIKMSITEQEALQTWKDFFNEGLNWRDFPQVKSHQDYLSIKDRSHITKIKQMPVKFLKESGNGFFIDKEGYLLSIDSSIEEYIKDEFFINQMKDILDYRTMEYYRRRYTSN